MANQSEMFFVITVEYPGDSTNTYTGTVTFTPYTTRQQVYDEVFRTAADQLKTARNRTNDPGVQFFSLEPNALTEESP